jgi:hypothetical protein
LPDAVGPINTSSGIIALSAIATMPAKIAAASEQSTGPGET